MELEKAQQPKKLLLKIVALFLQKTKNLNLRVVVKYFRQPLTSIISDNLIMLPNFVY